MRLPRPRPVPFQRRVADDIRGVVGRLTDGRELFLVWWSQLRAREPILEALQSEWQAWTAEDLLALEAPQLHAAHRFYEEVARTDVWMRYTEDMPVTLEQRFDVILARLTALAEAAEAALSVGDRPAPPPPA